MSPFEWVILALASFRLQRIVTKDTWYPTQWFREKLKERWLRAEDEFSVEISRSHKMNKEAKKLHRKAARMREENELFTCPWCFGFWTCAAVFAEHQFLALVPLWIYALFAASGLTGMLGMYDNPGSLKDK